MSKKRSRQVAFSDEVTVVRTVSYPAEGADDSLPKQQKLERDEELVGRVGTTSEDTPDLSHSQYKPGSRLRDQLESDSEPDDDCILSGDLKHSSKTADKAPVTKKVLEKGGLDEEDMFAQEKGTLEFDGDIKVTPFNLDEEMEEGRFDSEGNYYTYRDEEVTDNWLTDIDWSNVDEQGEMLSLIQSERAFSKPNLTKFIVNKEKLKDSSQSEITLRTKSECMSRIVCLLNPRETVAQALKRLKPTKQKANRKRSSDDSIVGEEKGENTFLELTELTDMMCYYKEYDIYSYSLEKLQNSLTSDQLHKTADPVTKPEMSSDEICWEYKTEEGKGSKVYGPFKSSQMLAWSSAGYFGDGVLVRRIDRRDGLFYTSKRVDFDIYT